MKGYIFKSSITFKNQASSKSEWGIDASIISEFCGVY